MIDFEKQNKPQKIQTNELKHDEQISHEQQDVITAEESIVKYDKHTHDLLHESIARLHALSEGDGVSPHMQKILNEEITKLGDIEKDICSLHEAYEKAKEESRRDPLTNLPNRRAFEESLETKLERIKESESTELYVLFIDIDKFKEVNDTFGHSLGDKYLCLIGHYISKELRPDDMIARIGGDEFAVTLFLRNPRDTSDDPFDHKEEASAISNRIYHAVLSAKSELWKEISSIEQNKMTDEQKDISEKDFLQRIASIGYIKSNKKDNVQKIMEKTDEVMYEVKKSGMSGVRQGF